VVDSLDDVEIGPLFVRFSGLDLRGLREGGRSA